MYIEPSPFNTAGRYYPSGSTWTLTIPRSDGVNVRYRVQDAPPALVQRCVSNLMALGYWRSAWLIQVQSRQVDNITDGGTSYEVRLSIRRGDREHVLRWKDGHLSRGEISRSSQSRAKQRILKAFRDQERSVQGGPVDDVGKLAAALLDGLTDPAGPRN